MLTCVSSDSGRGGSARSPDRTPDLTARFNEFRQQEVEPSGEEARYLVRPSGSLNSPVILHLNYPTFTSQRLSDGEVADETSTCPMKLMKYGWDATNALWMEASYRRTKAPEGRLDAFSDWSAALKACHKEFSNWLLTHSVAKACVVFGQDNREVFDKRKDLVWFTFQTTEGLWLKVALQSRHDLQLTIASSGRGGIARPPSSTSTKKEVVRVFVFTFHPEFIVRNPRPSFGRIYDLCFDLVASIGGIEGLRHGYFSTTT